MAIRAKWQTAICNANRQSKREVGESTRRSLSYSRRQGDAVTIDARAAGGVEGGGSKRVEGGSGESLLTGNANR